MTTKTRREPQAYDRDGSPIYPDWQEGSKLRKDPKDDWGERDLYDWVTCGTCGRRWNDALITSLTPAPSARCPFEYEHEYPDDEEQKMTEQQQLTLQITEDGLDVLERPAGLTIKVRDYTYPDDWDDDRWQTDEDGYRFVLVTV